jgi:hypothetical protein
MSLHAQLSLEFRSLTLSPPLAIRELPMIIRWLKGYIMPCPGRLQFVIDALRGRDRELPQIILQCSTNY